MMKAKPEDRNTIVNILVKSFSDNKSVNYIIRQDRKREIRLRRLMEYSHDVCKLFGEVFITEDKLGCALVVKPEKKSTSLKSIWLDLKFVVTCLGLTNVKKAMYREARIQSDHPEGSLYYLWFIGVEPGKQKLGIGSALLKELIAEGRKENRTICLETSSLKNIPWYQSFGFHIYKELDPGYKLFFLKKG